MSRWPLLLRPAAGSSSSSSNGGTGGFEKVRRIHPLAQPNAAAAAAATRSERGAEKPRFNIEYRIE